jgi:lysophospholipase L1-like esterase
VTRTERRRRRNLASVLVGPALTVASILVFLSVLELVVRGAGLAPEVGVIQRGRFRLSTNPRLGYEPVPGLKWSGDLAGEKHLYDFRGGANSLGFRDVEHALARPEGVFRIVVLGDSIAGGWGVERAEETFPFVLERLLGEQGHRAEVINLAVSGYNTRQEVEMLRLRGLAYHPDLVLVAYCLNDSEPLTSSHILTTLLNVERHTGGLHVRAHPLLARSALYRWVWSSLASRSRRSDAPRAAGDSVHEAFADLARLSREARFRVLVVIFPELLPERPYPRRAEHVRVLDLAAESGFASLDLLRPLRRCAGGALDAIAGDAVHPNAAGHRCAGQLIGDVIIQSLTTNAGM